MLLVIVSISVPSSSTIRIKAGAKNSKGEIVHDASYLPDIVKKYGKKKGNQYVFTWDNYVKGMGDWISTRCLEFYDMKFNEKKKGQGILPSVVFAQAMNESTLGTAGERYHTKNDIFGMTARKSGNKDWDENIDVYLKNFVRTKAKFYSNIWKEYSWQKQIAYMGGSAYCADPPPSSGKYVAKLYVFIKSYGAYKLDNVIKNKYNKVEVVNSHKDVFEFYEKITGYSESSMSDVYRKAKSKEQKEIHKVFDGNFTTSDESNKQQDMSNDKYIKMPFVSTVDKYETRTLNKYYKEAGRVADMSVEDRVKLGEIQNYVESKKEDKMDSLISNFRAYFVLFGILIIIYTFVIFLAYWFDRFNGIFEISLLSLVTFGHYIQLDDDVYGSEYENSSCRPMNMKFATRLLILGVLLGISIISGKVFTLVKGIYSIIKRV